MWTAILAVPIGLYAAYAFLFFAWLTATPQTEEGLARAQHSAYLWFFVTAACAIITVSYIVRALLSKPRNNEAVEKQQNEK